MVPRSAATGDGERVAVRNHLVGAVAAFLRGLGGNPLRVYLRGGSGSWSWSRDDVRLGRLAMASVYASGVQYVHSDHLGSPRKITDSSGNVKAYSDFYPFGLPAATNGIQPRWFAGYELEHQNTATTSTDDLYFLHARWYFPTMGRFLSPDPVRGKPQSPQSFNLYAYVQNNPINAVDPSGLAAIMLTGSRERAIASAMAELDYFGSLIARMVWSGMMWFALPQQAQEAVQEAQASAEEPPPTQGEDPVTRLVAAQDQARRTFRRDQDTGQTYCNQATLAIAQAVGAPTAPLVDAQGRALRANQMAQSLANSNQYRQVSDREAQALANRGVLVIAAWQNPNSTASGHVATVRPQGVPGDRPVAGSVMLPLINNIGRRNEIRALTQAFPLGPGNPPVLFYAPVGR
ncbi:tRNA3(Ser)-specific nuclease WapA [bacterium HR09]|nr:tRNA3(Ser)-specific nuclease WapA [bacterium HR09]